MEKKRLVWKAEGSSDQLRPVLRGAPVDPAKLVVELTPMEIRTFVIEFGEKFSFFLFFFFIVHLPGHEN